MKIADIRSIIRAATWTRSDLTGGTIDEFIRQDVGGRLTAKIEELRALEIAPRFADDIAARDGEIERCAIVIARWIDRRAAAEAKSAPPAPAPAPVVERADNVIDLTAARAETVIELMATEPLDPVFLTLMDSPDDLPFEGAARLAKPNPEWDRAAPRSVPQWIDGDPIHPSMPDARRFFGNFAAVSHVFTIDTDDPALIERMRRAIADNIASEAFRAITRKRAS